MARRLGFVVSMTLALAGLPVAGAEPGPPPSFAGDWTGIVIVRPAEYEVDVTLRVARANDGTLRGWISYPTQDAKEQPLESVTMGGDGKVKLVAKDEQGVISTFEGWLSGNGEDVDGDLAESGQHFLFNLHRGARPAPQAPVVTSMAETGEELISAFNQDRGRVRLLMILSPTCPMCLNGVRIVQRYVLDKIADPDLRVYVVWEGVSPPDTLATATAAATLITDPRVRQFWSAGRFAGKAFQSAVGLKSSPVWDVSLLFGVGKSWDAAPPVFDSFRHNLFGRPELPKDRHLNGLALAQEVGSLLGEKKPAVAVGPHRATYPG